YPWRIRRRGEFLAISVGAGLRAGPQASLGFTEAFPQGEPGVSAAGFFARRLASNFELRSIRELTPPARLSGRRRSWQWDANSPLAVRHRGRTYRFAPHPTPVSALMQVGGSARRGAPGRPPPRG